MGSPRRATTIVSNASANAAIRIATPPRATRARSMRGLERRGACFGDGLILLAQAAADADGSHDFIAAFERNSAGENHHAAVVGSVDAEELVAGLAELGELPGGDVEGARGPGFIDRDI